MKVSTRRLAYKLKQYKVKRDYVKGWNSQRIDPYNGQSDFWGVLLHHTAGTNSLGWIVNGNPYAPVRACHFLINRDGTVEVVSGVGAYHAGAGGPWRFPNGPTIPRDLGNRHLYGIEIESLGSSSKIDGSLERMSLEQSSAPRYLAQRYSTRCGAGGAASLFPGLFVTVIGLPANLMSSRP